MRLTLTYICLLLISFSAVAQDSTLIKKALKFQEKINHEFKDSLESPLPKEDFKAFKALDFFPIDTNLVIKAKFVRTPSESPFIMETTTERKPVYIKYGEAHFMLEDEEFVLSIYQSQQLITDPKFANYLFLPFTDNSNGEDSYAGGRYLDLKIPKNDVIILDFNQAYNPYCAYSGKYSCPIPPEDNHISLVIHAGVKNYAKKEKDTITN
jgi:uncharacterized protein (DUF1684 family)